VAPCAGILAPGAVVVNGASALVAGRTR